MIQHIWSNVNRSLIDQSITLHVLGVQNIIVIFPGRKKSDYDDERVVNSGKSALFICLFVNNVYLFCLLLIIAGLFICLVCIFSNNNNTIINYRLSTRS